MSKLDTVSEILSENADSSNTNLNTQNDDESNNNNNSCQLSDQNKSTLIIKSAKPQTIVKVEDFLNLSNSIKQEKQQPINVKSQQLNVNIKKGLCLFIL